MSKIPKHEKWIAHVDCGVCGHQNVLVQLDVKQMPWLYCPSCKSQTRLTSDKGDRSIRAKWRMIDRPAVTSESQSPVSHPPPIQVSKQPPESPPPVSAKKQDSQVAHSPEQPKASVLPKSPATKTNSWDIFA